MKYTINIPDYYKDLVHSVIVGKKLTELTLRERREIINGLSELAKKSYDVFCLLASLNLQYLYRDNEFEPAPVFEETDIEINNIYLINNEPVLIKSAYKNRFIGVLITQSFEVFVDCKRAMCIGSYNETPPTDQFDVATQDCYILHTPALGVFWGISYNDHGEDPKIYTVTDEKTVNDGVMLYNKDSSSYFSLMMTHNPDGKDELIDKLKKAIEEDAGHLKWFDFDEMELFHIKVSNVVKK